MSFIFNVSSFAIFAEYLILKLYTSISGSKIIDTIVSIGIQYLKLLKNVISKEFFSGSLKRENNKSIIWIYVFILITSFLESIGFSLIFVEFDKTLVWHLIEEKVYFIFYFIEGIFYGVTKSSISSLLLLTAFIIRQKLNGMKIFEFILSPYSENSAVFLLEYIFFKFLVKVFLPIFYFSSHEKTFFFTLKFFSSEYLIISQKKKKIIS
jgi:hypothetical protein